MHEDVNVNVRMRGREIDCKWSEWWSRSNKVGLGRQASFGGGRGRGKEGGEILRSE